MAAFCGNYENSLKGWLGKAKIFAFIFIFAVREENFVLC